MVFVILYNCHSQTPTALIPNSLANASSGVFQSSVWRGRVFRSFCTRFNSRRGTWLKSIPLGKYCLMSPLVFSLVPRCQGGWGSAKYICTFVSFVNNSCCTISDPRSWVIDLKTSCLSFCYTSSHHSTRSRFFSVRGIFCFWWASVCTRSGDYRVRGPRRRSSRRMVLGSHPNLTPMAVLESRCAFRIPSCSR